MKQQKKPDGDVLKQLIALILLAYLTFALFHSLVTCGVLSVDTPSTGNGDTITDNTVNEGGQ